MSCTLVQNHDTGRKDRKVQADKIHDDAYTFDYTLTCFDYVHPLSYSILYALRIKSYTTTSTFRSLQAERL